MKITVVSDIHGNLAALEAVLRHARGQGAAQRILNLGDSTGYGPEPDAVVRWSRGAQIINILGNYDKKVLSKEHRREDWSRVKTTEKREMFAWTYHALSKSSRKFLKSLPEKYRVDINGMNILMTHGSPASLTEHLRPETPVQRLAELAKMADADIVLCGHSHQAFVRRVNDVLFINPGSVGRPDDGDPRASYAVVDIQAGKANVNLFRVAYPITASVHAMERTGMPPVFSEVIRQGMNFDDVVEKFGKSPDRSAPEPIGTITLLTDFDLKDHAIGVMKGVIDSIAPQARVIDISHQIQPQNVIQAARMLAETVGFFAPGTVHIAVVGSGVETGFRAIAAQIGLYYYVAPDNGLLTGVLQQAESADQDATIVALEQSQYWMPDRDVTFHSRDIFAPVAAHLANGLPLSKLGCKVNDPLLLPLPQSD